MAIFKAVSMAVYWEQKNPNEFTGVDDATVEVQFPNGDKQFLIVQILGVSQKWKPGQNPVPIGFPGSPEEQQD